MMVKLSVSSWAFALTRLSIVGCFCLSLVHTTHAANTEMDETCSATDGTCSSSASPTTSSSSAAKALQCGIYMAPSTLGEETNMGIYTGFPRAKDDVVVKEIAVPLLFREWADHPAGYTDGDLWHRYIWEGPVMDIESYTETDRSDSRAVFVPGVGCTINGFMDMNNLKSTHSSTYDTAGLHRSKDPGAGASTPYHAALTTATEDIAAGSEIFADYGKDWIPDLPGVQITLDRPLDAADVFLLDRYMPFIHKHEDKMSPEMKDALWEFTTKDFPIYSQAMTNLPRHPWSEVEDFINKSLKDKDGKGDEVSVVRHFIRKQSIRTLDWLNEHGYCQDHITPGHSKINQAGYGAFASRDLPKGTIVGYAPLIHIGEQGREIWDIVYDDGAGGINGTRHLYDLVINYSFGHANSSVLLTPYGGMVNYINHDSKNPNVKVKWPEKELIAHKPEFLDKTPEDLRNTIEKIGLSFEYVALVDIKEGEELTMDYGKKWEDAWNEHVKNWKPLENADEYVHSTDWKQEYFATFEELEKKPYPWNLHTMCIGTYTTDEQGNYQWLKPLQLDPDQPLMEREYCDIVARNKQDVPKPGERPRGPKSKDGYLYDIILKREDNPDFSVLVHNVPSQGIFLYDKAFTNDWHLPNAFRHEIMIPDDVMPKAWLNGPPEHPF